MTKSRRIDEKTINEAVELLRRAAPGATIIVFGSAARGQITEDSDLDVMVVEPEVKNRWDEMVRLRDALAPLPIAFDVLVYSQETFDYWVDTPNTVIHEAAREGRIFEARSRTR